MHEILAKTKTVYLLYLLLWAVSACFAAEPPAENPVPNGLEGIWDPAKYISIDEIQPGMEAYCLTVYKGAEVEKFPMEVLDVVRNIMPGKDVILVQGTDERFIHTGPVAGCSGSPVYVKGRLAGAMAFGWLYSKDPLYGVTPIKEMLRVGEDKTTDQDIQEMGFAFDFSKPIDFAEIDRQIINTLASRKNDPAGPTTLPCPLIASGLPANVTQQLSSSVEPFGLFAVPGIGATLNTNTQEQTQLTPGAVLAIPLLTGDMRLEVIGTVTEVIDDKVLALGHSFLGYGPIDLPMATGKVHTVVSTVTRSFKLASSTKVVGALKTDQASAVLGKIGAKAKTISLTINVDRYNDTEKRVYNCQLANNKLLTPSVARAALAGAALMFGDLPPEHSIRYDVTIGIRNLKPFTFENVSTGEGLTNMLTETQGSVALLMNNPYEKVDIESINCDLIIKPKNTSAGIWSVDLSDSTVNPGQQIDVSVIIEPFLAPREEFVCTFRIPDQLPPGTYDLIVCGADDYRQFLTKAAPYKFLPQSLNALIETMENLLHVQRDKLYCILTLPPAGIAVEKAELPDLPDTKTLIFQDAKRTLETKPYQHWLEKSLKTGTVLMDKKVMQITVEEYKHTIFE